MKKYSLLVGAVLLCCIVFSQKTTSPNNGPTTVITCSDFHITKPLSELSKEFPYVEKKKDTWEVIRESFDRENRSPQTFEHTAEENPELYGNDPNSIQKDMGTRFDENKAPLKNWPGQSSSGFRPLDPSGAAGPNHYIQAINGTPFRVFNKTTGANMLTANIGSLWSPATPDDGDPIVMYDKYADRWFISQFGQTGNKIYIAISTTSDPLGSYYTYSFTSSQFPDYLKFGIWADGYYMTSNQATDKVFCFERDQMLIGNASARAVSQTFTTGATSSFFVPLPADADGGLPTVGTPCPFLSYSDNAWGTGVVDGVKIWNMSVTWGATPAATITLNTTIPTAAFDASYDSGWNDVSQPGTTQKLDGIGGVPTYRAQWRKWNGYNTLVMNWGVKISATQRSIKWVELRQNQTTGVWSLYQEGTYTPDAHTRWLGSIAMDNNGSIALCYAKSSTSVYPSLCYTGRISTDPLGTMSFAETVAAAGTGSETSGNRFGDYSQTSLDPDGITFWHTGEYTLSSGTTTRVYSFQLPAPALNAPPVADFSASSTTPCIGSTVTFTDFSTNTPTSWAWTFSPTSVTYVGGTSSSSQNPQVQFNAAGPYTVTLVATNAYGNDSEIKTNYITPLSGGTLPLVENFEGATFPPTGWTIDNADAPSIAWGTAGVKGLERRAAAGNTGSTTGCAGIEMFNYSDTNQVDNLVSSPLNLIGATAPKMTFKRSYKTYVSSTNPQFYRDELKIYVSTDCGATWGSAIYFKKGAQLATNGTLNTTFTPTVTADWDIDTVNLTAYVGQTVKVKFEFVNRYGNNLYLDDINIDNSASTVATVSIVSNDTDNTICSGASVTFTATPVNGGTAPTYQWQVNGVNAGTNSPTFTTTTLTNGQSVTCIMTSNLSGVTGSPATSNAITTTVNTVPASPAVTTNSPVCAGSTINFTTTTVSGATYAWTGPNAYTSAVQNPTIANATSGMAGTYNLAVTVNGCTSGTGTGAIVVNSTVTPTISIALTTGSNPSCNGTPLTFTATPTNGGTTPVYQWKVNGVNAGTNSASFTTSTLTNGQTVSCDLTSNAVCVLPATATSNTITITINPTVAPAISISTSNSTICAGGSATFTATATNGGTTPFYQWQVNGSNVGTNNNTFTSSTLTNGQIVTCILTSNETCASPSVNTSNGLTMTVDPIPATPVITTNSPVCEGSAINVSTSTVTGASYAWTGPNTFSSALQNPTITGATTAMSGTYNLTVTVNGCSSVPSTGSVTVNSAVSPGVAIAITSGGNPTCISQTVTYTATPTNGGTTPSYQWQINGTNVGTNAATYTPVSIADNDVVTCIMTSNAVCTSTPTAISNSITMSVTTSVTPSVSIAASSNPACAGSTVTFTATPTNGGTTPSYQWKLNGANVGTNSLTYSNAAIANNDVITCEMTSNSTCASPSTATSNAITMVLSSSVTPSISIAITTGSNPMCSGTTTTFTATPTNGGTTPVYQWMLNGSNVGSGGTNYTTATLANNDVITCVLTSNSTCVTTANATSNAIAIIMNVGVTPTASISTSSTSICAGTTATFTATGTNLGTNPIYQWQVNGSNVGTNSTGFTSSALTNGDAITCIITSNANCLNTPTATSNTLSMVVSSSITPSVSIALTSGTNPTCSGANVIFSATQTNGGSSPIYQWNVNGVNAGTNSTTFTTNGLLNGDIVTCVLTSNAQCVTSNTASSNGITMAVAGSVTPIITIALSSGTNPSCSGSMLSFTATPQNGGTTPIYQWKVNGNNVGTNSSVFSSSALINNDVITCVLTSNANCATTTTANSNAITIVVTGALTPTITISPSATSVCTGTTVTFTPSVTNEGTNPSFSWSLNGSQVGTGTTYATSSLTSIDVVNCTMTSNATCLTTQTALSNNSSVNVSSPVTPAVTISLTSDNNPACQGSNIIFNAAPTNGGISPEYQWQVNGTNVGTNNATFSSTNLNNNNVVTCILTSNAGCLTNPNATSSGITMIVNPIPATPTITVSAGGTILTSSSPTGNQWYLNGIMITGANGQTLNAPQNGNYTVIVSNGTCSSNASAVTLINSVGINEVSNAGTHFIIYPNPSSGKFTVMFTSTEIMKYKIELRNVIGQIVYFEELKDFNGTYTKDFDLTEYGKGEYFLVITDSKRHKMEKVVLY